MLWPSEYGFLTSRSSSVARSRARRVRRSSTRPSGSPRTFARCLLMPEPGHARCSTSCRRRSFHRGCRDCACPSGVEQELRPSVEAVCLLHRRDGTANRSPIDGTRSVLRARHQGPSRRRDRTWDCRVATSPRSALAKAPISSFLAARALRPEGRLTEGRVGLEPAAGRVSRPSAPCDGSSNARTCWIVISAHPSRVRPIPGRLHHRRES